MKLSLVCSLALAATAMVPAADALFGRLPKLPPRPPAYEAGFTNANPIAA